MTNTVTKKPFNDLDFYTQDVVDRVIEKAKEVLKFGDLDFKNAVYNGTISIKFDYVPKNTIVKNVSENTATDNAVDNTVDNVEESMVDSAVDYSALPDNLFVLNRITFTDEDSNTNVVVGNMEMFGMKNMAEFVHIVSFENLEHFLSL